MEKNNNNLVYAVNYVKKNIFIYTFIDNEAEKIEPLFRTNKRGMLYLNHILINQYVLKRRFSKF